MVVVKVVVVKVEVVLCVFEAGRGGRERRGSRLWNNVVVKCDLCTVHGVVTVTR